MRTILCLLLVTATARAADPAPGALGATPTWKPPAVETVRDRAMAWLDEQKADAAARAKAAQLWANVPAETTPDELLARLSVTFALVDPRAGALVQLCSKPRESVLAPSQPWLADAKTSPWMAANLRLLFGRWLAQASMFDEAREQLAGLSPEAVVDPAALLFYRAVVYHRLLEKEPGLEAIDRLLTGAEQAPRRYVAVARLMREDLDGLQEETLDHVARRMEDIERRLDLGRADDRVRQVERGVIESLDKMIKELEQQQQQQSGAANNVQSSRPASDSQLMGGRGPGEVTKRDVGKTAGWGNLPPKQREEAMQQIGREFPSHYQDVIEQYFRKLAAEEE
ncbi:MAG: hypothetical protein NTW96_17740 [Planctomycetia bacterium]|nr:hypothetical protein [Planctomycetia bacterium]